MKIRSRIYPAIPSILIAALACNVPSGADPQNTNGGNQQQNANLDEALTLAVGTIQAATQTAAAAGPSPTAPSIAPMVTVSSDTNCRTGPNINYAFVMFFTTGMNAAVVAKHTPTGYWIIKYPGGNGATCWLWGQWATVVGETVGLPEGVPPPPPPLPPTATPPPSAPRPPRQVEVISCTVANIAQSDTQPLPNHRRWTVELNWKDNSDDEQGFSIYKDGTLLASVGPGQTSYADVFTTPPSHSFTTHVYAVRSFNDFGASVLKDTEISKCPYP